MYRVTYFECNVTFKIKADAKLNVSNHREIRKPYYAKKHLKDKTTSDIGFGRISDNKIYIAESLTSKNKELFKKCLDARRSLNYKFI